MRLRRVRVEELTAKQKEIYNFQRLAGRLAEYGFNCIKLADDWQGADFLAYHKDGDQTLKVQLKSRLTIYKKYLGKNLFMSFPVNETWFLIRHDELVEIVTAATDWLKTASWVEKGLYHSYAPSKKLLASLAEFAL